MIITVAKRDLDLTSQQNVNNFFENEYFDEIYITAARVGGIYANNQYPAEFIYENIMIQANLIHAAQRSDIQKLLFLGSSCIYPMYSDSL